MDERARIQLMSQDIQSLQKQFGKNLILNENLSKYSWFNLGGEAEYFFKPKNSSELLEFLKEVKKNKIKTTFIGAGSNILFRDNGFKGAVIKLGKNFSYISKKKIIFVRFSLFDDE